MRVFWDVAPCSLVAVDPDDGAVRTSLKSVYSNKVTRRYISEGSRTFHTRRLENLKTHTPSVAPKSEANGRYPRNKEYISNRNIISNIHHSINHYRAGVSCKAKEERRRKVEFK
jgi:hypothetical protein